jgi:NAD(P)-dependent dehydrogenase (short-subunit alcohol dehydrogenase family)
MSPDTTADSRPRAVLITGGAHGLGAALARHFATAGDHVAIADIDVAAGRGLAESTGCLFLATDVGVFSENQAAVAATVERFGGLDALCLNAGGPGGTSIGVDFDPEAYRRGLQVTLDGAVYGINAALPALRARGGAVLITSSLAGIAPALDPYYAAAKHALIGLTRSFALILKADHIRVNALCPGLMDTRLIADVRGRLIARGIAIADPTQVAAAAATVLASPATGQAWEIQAGRPPTPVEFPEVTLRRRPDTQAPEPLTSNPFPKEGTS